MALIGRELTAPTSFATAFGLLQQILTAFRQVSSSFQYLVNSWPTIVELQSIHKRLQAFETAFAADGRRDAE